MKMADKELRQQVLQGFIREAQMGKAALDQWLYTLGRWYLSEVQTSDDDFMQAVQEMALAGMLEFIDGSPSDIDKLREVLTGVEA
jgi:hypothetical protein